MDFVHAFKHMVIGYGIRRTVWHTEAILTLTGTGELRWLKVDEAFRQHKPTLGGPDRSFDISVEDMQATDWETV